MKQEEKILKNVAEKLGKDKEVTEKVCRSIFGFLTEVMREGKYEPYRIQGLGVYKVEPYMKEKAEKIKLRKEEKIRKNKELFDKLKD
jgi:nucleoid DNA-binding protein